MLSGISVVCFAASYLVAMLIEVSRLFQRAKISRWISLGFTAAGLFAHTLYLVAERGGILETVVSSWHQWGMMTAWFLAATYLLLTISQPETSLGLFMMPLILLVVAATYLSDQVAPFAQSSAPIKAWGQIHGIALLAGTVVVALGCISGMMYLIQSYRLKHKLIKQDGFRLPSLEWLESSNRKALLVSTCLIAVGLLSGVLLKIGKDSFPWTDPVIWSSGILFLWLTIATIFELVYKPARQGNKVAYLTLANFLFLAIVLGLLFFGPSEHAQGESEETSSLMQTIQWFVEKPDRFSDWENRS